MARVRAWLSAAGITGGPMFQRLDKAGRPRGRLSTVSIRAIIQRRAAEAEGRVSGHSLRVGGAQSLAAAGASIVEMQTAGRWQSPSMPSRYAQGPARHTRRGGQASLRGVEPPMGGAPYSRAGSSSPLSPCANAHKANRYLPHRWKAGALGGK